METDQLQSLKAALAASPDNQVLFLLVLQAQLDCGAYQEAYDFLLNQCPGVLEKDPDRLLAAKICMEVEDYVKALDFASSSDAEHRLLCAHVFCKQDRLNEGLAAYEEAVRQNATLEDPELAAKLKSQSSKIRSIHRKDRPRLHVISNDNTNQSEMNRLVMPPEAVVTFDQVGGLTAIKKQISRKIILPFQKPSLFQKFRKKVGGGILLYGPPGCGKTLLARATAGECKAKFFNVIISDVLDMYIGESEQKLHAIFEEARHSAPSVIFFDELEALGGKRQYTREATSSKLVSQFLSELDGFTQQNHGVLILGATNVPWAIDSAFRRPGRFDRVLFVSPPDQLAREAILQLLLKDRPSEQIRLEHWAKQTSGFSGADLSNLVETAVDEVIEESLENDRELGIADQHLERALQEVKPTTLEWLTTARNYARYANESGQYDEVLQFLKQHGKS